MDQFRIATPRSLQGRPEHFEHAPGRSEELGAVAKAFRAPVDAVGLTIGRALAMACVLARSSGFSKVIRVIDDL